VTLRHFDSSLGCLIGPTLGDLATQLGFLRELSVREREVILEATRESLYAVLHGKVSRLLVLELNAARVTGRLGGEGSSQRWQHFLELSSDRSFWGDLASHYPPLLSRIDVLVRNRCAATLRFAQHWASDRQQLAILCDGDPGELHELRFGAGDSHGGGFTVAVLDCEGGRLVYKPRSVAIDIALRSFVAELEKDHGGELSIGVPAVVDCGDYGWAEFITHRYAAGKEKLVSFYHGIGHLLAIMRLLGGSDLHAENLIARGVIAVVVDCETLFTPKVPPSPSGYGAALDRAAELVTNTVITVGLLPGRAPGLAWRGIDASALGNLPGQQPIQQQLGIINGGSDEARVGAITVAASPSQNHPSPEPALAEYWPEVLSGFDDVTATLRRLDSTRTLRKRLRVFKECRIRVVLRRTEVYAEIARMLWHPVSLHRPEEARRRAFELLKKMADNVSMAPSDLDVINAEIDALLEGDIPYFSTVVSKGRLDGPRGTHWLPPRNLVEAALANWRGADFALERAVIQASLVSAYINDGWIRDPVSPLPKRARGGDMESRRRRQAAKIMRRLVANATYGDDGSVAWIAPVLSEIGWSVQPLQEDLYNGISGIALLAGAYLHEAASDRADPIAGLDRLLLAALNTLLLTEAKREQRRSEGPKIRPLLPGGYIGLGSQIWTYLALAHWGLDGGVGLRRASKLADEIPAAAALDDTNDLIYGTAGAIAPLLLLARKTGDERYVHMASQLGDLLWERVKHRDGRAYWVHSYWPEGLGGFAHGVTGIGWALTLLARATGNARYDELAQEAFAFEDTLFDEGEQNWRDLRILEGVKTRRSWCHGSVGIGLAHLNLDPTLAQASTRRIVRRAVAATWRREMGCNHCACHGDLGAWELLDHATVAGLAPQELSVPCVLDLILSSLEERGPSCGIGANVSAPGLLPGLGGAAYQLLRAHPENDLPSILTPCGNKL
jgi:type 2 lantibiotic biosynthesis protein LanM